MFAVNNSKRLWVTHNVSNAGASWAVASLLKTFHLDYVSLYWHLWFGCPSNQPALLPSGLDGILLQVALLFFGARLGPPRSSLVSPQETPSSCYSKCSPGTNSLSMSWELMHFRYHSRPSDLESAPEQGPQGILMHTKGWGNTVVFIFIPCYFCSLPVNLFKVRKHSPTFHWPLQEGFQSVMGYTGRQGLKSSPMKKKYTQEWP